MMAGEIGRCPGFHDSTPSESKVKSDWDDDKDSDCEPLTVSPNLSLAKEGTDHILLHE